MAPRQPFEGDSVSRGRRAISVGTVAERRNESASRTGRRAALSASSRQESSPKSQIHDVRTLRLELQESKRISQSMLKKCETAETKKSMVQNMLDLAQQDVREEEEVAAAVQVRLEDREARLRFDEDENSKDERMAELKDAIETAKTRLPMIEAEASSRRNALAVVMSCLSKEEEAVQELTGKLSEVMRGKPASAGSDGSNVEAIESQSAAELHSIQSRLFQLEQVQGARDLEAHASVKQLWDEHQAAESSEIHKSELALQEINGFLMECRVSHKIYQQQVNDLKAAAERNQDLKRSLHEDLKRSNAQSTVRATHDETTREFEARAAEINELHTYLRELQSRNNQKYLHEIRAEKVAVKWQNEQAHLQLAKYESRLSECCDQRQSELVLYNEQSANLEKEMHTRVFASREEVESELCNARMEAMELRCESSFMAKTMESLRVAASRSAAEENEQRKSLLDVRHRLVRMESEVELERGRRDGVGESGTNRLRDELLQSEQEAKVLRSVLAEIRQQEASAKESRESNVNPAQMSATTESRSHRDKNYKEKADSGSGRGTPRSHKPGTSCSRKSLDTRERLMEALKILVDGEFRTVTTLDKEQEKGCKTARWKMALT